MMAVQTLNLPVALGLHLIIIAQIFKLTYFSFKKSMEAGHLQSFSSLGFVQFIVVKLSPLRTRYSFLGFLVEFVLMILGRIKFDFDLTYLELLITSAFPSRMMRDSV